MPFRVYNVYDEDSDSSLPAESILFPGGEYHFQLNTLDFSNRHIWVDARCRKPEHFLELITLLDAIRGCNPKRLGLFLPYFPGARQDRRTAPGTPFTLELYANILRSLKLDVIVSMDVHSKVTADKMGENFVRLEPQIFASEKFSSHYYDGIIQPDAGAESRANGFASCMSLPVYRGTKVRDPKTGRLSQFECEPLTPGRYLLVDDICDGGGTFVGLASAIHNQCPLANLDLWVTHGIFSKGYADLLSRFSTIHTTDSFAMKTSFVPPEVKIYPMWFTAARIMRERIST